MEDGSEIHARDWLCNFEVEEAFEIVEMFETVGNIHSVAESEVAAKVGVVFVSRSWDVVVV